MWLCLYKGASHEQGEYARNGIVLFVFIIVSTIEFFSTVDRLSCWLLEDKRKDNINEKKLPLYARPDDGTARSCLGRSTNNDPSPDTAVLANLL